MWQLYLDEEWQPHTLSIQCGSYTLRNGKLIHCWFSVAAVPWWGMATLYIVNSMSQLYLDEKWQSYTLLIQCGSSTLMRNGSLIHCQFNVAAVPWWGLATLHIVNLVCQIYLNEEWQPYTLLIQCGSCTLMRNGNLIHCQFNVAALPRWGMATLYIVGSVWQLYYDEEWQPCTLSIQCRSDTTMRNGNLTHCWYSKVAVPWWGMATLYIVNSMWQLYLDEEWQPYTLLIQCGSCPLF